MYAFLMALCAILPFSWYVLASRIKITKKSGSVDLSPRNHVLIAEAKSEFTADDHPVAKQPRELRIPLPKLLW